MQKEKVPKSKGIKLSGVVAKHFINFGSSPSWPYKNTLYSLKRHRNLKTESRTTIDVSNTGHWTQKIGYAVKSDVEEGKGRLEARRMSPLYRKTEWSVAEPDSTSQCHPERFTIT